MKLIVSTFLVYKVKKCLLKSGKVRVTGKWFPLAWGTICPCNMEKQVFPSLLHSSPTPDTCSAKAVDNGHQPCGLFRAPWRSNKLQKPIISAIVGKQHIGVSPTMAMAGNLIILSCLLPFSRVLLLKCEKGVNPNRSLDFHSAPSWFRYHFISVPCFDLYFL